MRPLLDPAFRLLVLVFLIHLSLSPGTAYASFSLVDLEPAARWEFSSVWRGQVSERDFTSLATLVEGRERMETWSGFYQLTFRPDPSTDLSLAAVRAGTSARVETHFAAPPYERRINVFRESGWRSIGLSAGRRWVSSSNGASWRLGLDVSLCELPGACAPRLSSAQVGLAQVSDPVVWRASLTLARSTLTISGGVDVVINPVLAAGASLRLSRPPGPGDLAAWWDQMLTFHLGKERYVSISLGLDLVMRQPSLTVGIHLPMGGM